MHHTAAVSDIWDRAQYADGAPHEVFAELRRTSPVHWQDIPGQEGKDPAGLLRPFLRNCSDLRPG